MKRGLLLLIILIFCSSLAFAAENDCIYYFYGDGCETCPEVTNFIDGLKNEYPLNVVSHEVYFNIDNLRLMQKYFNAYSVPKEEQGLPVIFMKNSYFVGHESILSLLEARIKDNPDDICPSLENVEVIGIIGKSSTKSVLDRLSFWNVSGSALLSSLAPGALALLLVFLAIIMALKDREEMLKRGFLYILGIYLAYLLFGMGLFAWFGYSGVGTFVSKVIGFLAVIFALAMVKDFFVSWKITFKNIRNEYKVKIKKVLAVILSPYGMLFTGFILGFLTFTRLNKTFLLIRFLFMEGSTRLIAVPILLYHLVIQFLLMVIILVAVYLLKEYKHRKARKKHPTHERKANLWHMHYLKVMNFVISVVMLILGLVVIFL
jgi:hypothetical protein